MNRTEGMKKITQKKTKIIQKKTTKIQKKEQNKRNSKKKVIAGKIATDFKDRKD